MLNKYLIGGVVAILVIGGAWYHGYSYGYDKAAIDNQEARQDQLDADANNAEKLDEATQQQKVIIQKEIQYVYQAKDDSGCLDYELDDGLYELVR